MYLLHPNDSQSDTQNIEPRPPNDRLRSDQAARYSTLEFRARVSMIFGAFSKASSRSYKCVSDAMRSCSRLCDTLLCLRTPTGDMCVPCLRLIGLGDS